MKPKLKQLEILSLPPPPPKVAKIKVYKFMLHEMEKVERENFLPSASLPRTLDPFGVASLRTLLRWWVRTDQRKG